MAPDQGEDKALKPRFIKPELATLTENYFSDKDWIYEEKFDGIRCIAVKSGGKVSLYSRNHKSLNKDFPEVVKALEAKRGRDFVVDGEVVAYEGKVTSFSKLQQRKKEKVKIYYFLFDLLVWGEEDLRKESLLERKKQLKTHFPFGGTIRYTTHIKKRGEEFYMRACKKGLEGIIAKNAQSKYQSKRTRNWLKFKCSVSDEFVIGGFTKPKGSRVGFGALLVGYYDKGAFKYAGKVGTGYNTSLLKSLGAKLKKLERKSCPFTTIPKQKDVHFVRPSLACIVGFTEWTNDKKLRHPRFLGLCKK
ncbi:MAG: non-homologous end-joining DNA ligase [Simkaniaceae bacterium]|nr:non-homologous end-joining DNA ligase [Candidatus Sacchlamyda saccharinae]